MYITRVEIRNIRSIKKLVWKIDAADAPGWHVILGDNGSGKSTFVQSAALAMIGVADAPALRLDYNEWLSRNSESADITVALNRDAGFDGPGEGLPKRLKCLVSLQRFFPADHPGSVGAGGQSPNAISRERGWFAASYGPFRRFSGGNPEAQQLLKTAPHIARHSSLFSDGVALTEGSKWLKDLQFKRLEEDIESAILIDTIIRFINQDGFLPSHVRLAKVASDGVHFTDANNVSVEVESLSDGFKSLLSMTLELLRQLSLTFGKELFTVVDEKTVNVKVPGVVLIDEIDAHLHPTWQKQIGFWLTKYFPKVQFFVTTHSPLICQAAVRGTIFRLPTPGTDEVGRLIEGAERNRLLYGNILDAYSTQAFGYGVTRSKVSAEKLNRLADLNLKEIFEDLSADETDERETLRDMFPTNASALPSGEKV